MTALWPPYHFTLVVDDVPRAMEDLTRLFGIQWTRVQADGLFAYSLQGPPYLELLKRVDGTIHDSTGLHHVGVWVDDPQEESNRLASLGAPLEFVRRDSEGRWLPGCFHKTADGLRIELVTIGTSGPKLIHLLSGRDYE